MDELIIDDTRETANNKQLFIKIPKYKTEKFTKAFNAFVNKDLAYFSDYEGKEQVFNLENNEYTSMDYLIEEVNMYSFLMGDHVNKRNCLYLITDKNIRGCNRVNYCYEDGGKHYLFAFHTTSPYIEDIEVEGENKGFLCVFDENDEIKIIHQLLRCFILPDNAFNNSDIYVCEDDFLIKYNDYLNYLNLFKGVDLNGILERSKSKIKAIDKKDSPDYRLYLLTVDDVNRILGASVTDRQKNLLSERIVDEYYAFIKHPEHEYHRTFIKKKLKELNMKVKDLANSLNMPVNNYNKRLEDKNRDAIEKIAEVLKLTTDEKELFFNLFGLSTKTIDANLKDEINNYLNRNKNIIYGGFVGAMTIADIKEATDYNDQFYYSNLDHPTRDFIIGVSLALHLTLDETEELLNHHGFGGLNKSIEGRLKDCLIRACIREKVYIIPVINLLLSSQYFKEKTIKGTH